jgi:hypothetical protein
MSNDKRGWAMSLQRKSNCQNWLFGKKERTAQPPTPDNIKNTHRVGFLTPLRENSKRSWEKHAAGASGVDVWINMHLNRRVQQEGKRQLEIIFFPLRTPDLSQKARRPNTGDTVVVQVNYDDYDMRYYLLHLHTDQWDYLTRRDAELRGTMPSELTYYDGSTSRPVRYLQDLTLMKGSQVTESGTVLMTYTAVVTAKKQLLVHVEVRDPFKTNGGKNYYLPTGTTVRRLRKLHGHENAIWKCQFTKVVLTNHLIIDNLAKKHEGHACVVVLDEDRSVSSEETEDDNSAEEDCYHPKPKRRRLLLCA